MGWRRTGKEHGMKDVMEGDELIKEKILTAGKKAFSLFAF
jgi:hypothetical protein